MSGDSHCFPRVSLGEVTFSSRALQEGVPLFPS